MFVLASCQSAPVPSSTPTQEVGEAGLLPLPSAQPVPPTFTPSGPEPLPTATTIPTRPPQPTDIPATPIPFDDVVITVHMRIPAISYDRRLEGNIGSELIFVDESAAKGQFRARQAVILIELQQALDDLLLAPVPEGCEQCVDLEVTFPLEEVEIRGWLQDPILLASLENLFEITLGPHFSPDAVAGLRRSASPYAPAHTIEIQADGTLFFWQGNQDRVIAKFAASDALNTAVSQTVNTAFQTQYAAACEGVPIETLMLKSDSGGIQMIQIACPAFAIPLPLLDLYVQFDALMGEAVLDSLPVPDTAVPLTAVFQFEREDGVMMIIENDGAMSLDNGVGNLITDTLTIESVAAFTTPILESGIVSLGLTTFQIEDEAAKTAVLFIRGQQGLYDGAWSETQSIAELTPLNSLIDSYLSPESDDQEEEESEGITATPDGSAATPTATP